MFKPESPEILNYKDERKKIQRAAAANVAEITEAMELLKYAEQALGEQGTVYISAITEIMKKYLA